MKKIFFFIFLTSLIYAQNYSDSVRLIEDYFKSFKYAEVINSSSELLKREEIPVAVAIDIYLMKGVSHFVLKEDTLAKNSFIEILKRNPDYMPDSGNVSPKIIRFFKDVKENEKDYYISQKEIVANIQPVANDSGMIYYRQRIKTSITRSLLFPGLGHVYNNDEKGWYLTVAGGVTLLSSIYFSVASANYRSYYMQERNPGLIADKFDDYNTSYKLRNISFSLFGLIWLFSQFDLISNVIDQIEIPPSIMLTPSNKGGEIVIVIPF
jgi:hypothetical protein